MMFDDLDVEESKSEEVKRIKQELDAYFHHEKKMFDCQVAFENGTDFQQSVWRALLDIPYGETRSYQEIAQTIGRPKAVRAVGQACKRNPIGLVVPCHRVIGKDGSMTGYSGKDYVDLKQRILNFEKGL
jgi:O-6-methylguanine DNA methyltransferase